MSIADGYQGTVRIARRDLEFDRIGVSCELNIPFGTVSRIFGEWENDGYICRVGEKAYDVERIFKERPHLAGKRINYGKNQWGMKRSVRHRKNPTFETIFIPQWEEFLRLMANHQLDLFSGWSED